MLTPRPLLPEMLLREVRYAKVPGYGSVNRHPHQLCVGEEGGMSPSGMENKTCQKGEELPWWANGQHASGVCRCDPIIFVLAWSRNTPIVPVPEVSRNLAKTQTEWRQVVKSYWKGVPLTTAPAPRHSCNAGKPVTFMINACTVRDNMRAKKLAHCAK